MVHNLFLHLMHTEDDTFAALKRIPFVEMRSKIGRARLLWIASGRDTDLSELCKSHGWTLPEYEYQLQLTFTGEEGMIIKTDNTYKVSYDRALVKYKR